jgi:putative NADPH-quinone reductase
MGYLQQSLAGQSGAEGHQGVMIHRAVSNVGHTWDGVVAAGGLRLAREIERVIDNMQQESRRLHRLQVSVFVFLCRWWRIPWVACTHDIV